MKKNPRVLIIDGNNNLYRAYYRLQSMVTIDGTKSGTIYGFLTMTRGLINKFKPDLVYCIFDGNKSKHRLNLLPDYKNREPKENFDAESFFSQRDDIMKCLKYLGITCIKEPGYEADDLMYVALRKHKNDEVIICSRDKDFYQLLTNNISIWDGHDQVLYTPKNLYTRKGYHPEQTVDYLTLDGDKSDHIPGIPGFGVKTIDKFLNKFGSIETFFKTKGDFGTPGEKITKEKVELNRSLIDLKYFYKKYLKQEDLSFMDIQVKGKKIKTKKAKALLLKYETRLMYKPEFIETFENYVKQ